MSRTELSLIFPQTSIGGAEESAAKTRPKKEGVDMPNDYSQLLETWKADLILDRAKRKSFRPDELDDVTQEVVQAVLSFRFLPEKSNGATELTALTAVIDNQLAALRRSRARQCRREEKHRRLCGARAWKAAPEPTVASHEDEVCLKLDVRAAVAGLSNQEQTICAALVQGENRATIATSLGISRYEMDRLVDSIRSHFSALGLNE
jgi:hypothetical protein